MIELTDMLEAMLREELGREPEAMRLRRAVGRLDTALARSHEPMLSGQDEAMPADAAFACMAV